MHAAFGKKEQPAEKGEVYLAFWCSSQGPVRENGRQEPEKEKGVNLLAGQSRSGSAAEAKKQFSNRSSLPALCTTEEILILSGKGVFK